MSDGSVEGRWVRLEPVDDSNRDELAELDWKRSQLPAMGGWFVRPDPVTPWATMLIRGKESGQVAGVIEASPLPGYPGVANVSQFMDAEATRILWAMDAYGMYITHLFEQGVRLVHHEVLEINRPVQRLMKGIKLEPTARMRQHGYAAGQLWDVLVYSYGAAHWQTVLAKFPRRGRAVAK